MNTLALEDCKEAITNELDFLDDPCLPYPPCLTIEELMARLEESVRQAKNGQTITTEELEREMATW
ncbi:hypothetical protein Barb6XT_00808 [Bacteroidales bacterium Barb6XT]|nr:hypothetical protein Barb6XT_00808 [Bacteroidales bacterium Barb6XT]